MTSGTCTGDQLPVPCRVKHARRDEFVNSTATSSTDFLSKSPGGPVVARSARRPELPAVRPSSIELFLRAS